MNIEMHHGTIAAGEEIAQPIIGPMPTRACRKPRSPVGATIDEWVDRVPCVTHLTVRKDHDPCRLTWVCTDALPPSQAGCRAVPRHLAARRCADGSKGGTVIAGCM